MQTDLNAGGNQWPWLASCQYRLSLRGVLLIYRAYSLLVSRPVEAWPLCTDPASFGYLIGNYPTGWLLQHYHCGRVFSISESVRALEHASRHSCSISYLPMGYHHHCVRCRHHHARLLQLTGGAFQRCRVEGFQ